MPICHALRPMLRFVVSGADAETTLRGKRAMLDKGLEKVGEARQREEAAGRVLDDATRQCDHAAVVCLFGDSADERLTVWARQLAGVCQAVEPTVKLTLDDDGVREYTRDELHDRQLRVLGG